MRDPPAKEKMEDTISQKYAISELLRLPFLLILVGDNILFGRRKPFWRMSYEKENDHFLAWTQSWVEQARC